VGITSGEGPDLVTDLKPPGNASQNPAMRVLSLDIPWGGGTFVGAAYAELRDGQFQVSPALDPDQRVTVNEPDSHEDQQHNQGPVVTSVSSVLVSEVGQPAFPISDPEIAGFIADGAGLGRSRPADMSGPFNAFPHTPATREAYLRRLWAAFHSVRRTLEVPEGRGEPVVGGHADRPRGPGACLPVAGQGGTLPGPSRWRSAAR
jgi:hypothetical protein